MWSGRGVDHLHLYSAEVKERVELYLFSPLVLPGLFWAEIYLELGKEQGCKEYPQVSSACCSERNAMKFPISAKERVGKLIYFKARKLILLTFNREYCTSSMH